MLPSVSAFGEIADDLTRLSVFAVEARYPGEWEEATAEDAAFALTLARSVVAAARADLLSRGLPGIDELPPLPGQIL